MRTAWLALLTSLVTAHARADILPAPTRPDWDTPVPMPPEVAWIAIAVLALLCVTIGRALASRAR